MAPTAVNARPASSPALPDPAVDVLRELLAEIRGLREDLRGHRSVIASASLGREDRARLGRLLPAIAGALGSEPFASRDLPTTSPGLRVVLRGLSVKQIGRLLSRAEGVSIDGWIVERYGTEINVVLWRVLGSVSNRLETGTAIARSGSIGAGEPNA